MNPAPKEEEKAWQIGLVELKKQSKKLFQALEELGFGGKDE